MDATISKILKVIQEEVKINFNKEFSEEDLQGVVNAQIEATKLGISKGITVSWDRFCKFIFTDRYDRKMDTISQLNHIKKYSEDLSLEEQAKLNEEIIIASHQKKKAYLQVSVKGEVTPTAKVLKTKNKNKLTVQFFNLKKE